MNQNKTQDERVFRDCPECGGDVQPGVTGNFRDWICQDCGRVVGGGQLVSGESTTDND